MNKHQQGSDNSLLELSAYLIRLNGRMEELIEYVDTLEDYLEEVNNKTNYRKVHIKTDFQFLKRDISKLKEDINEIKKAILLVINQLKRSVKAEDFQRLKNRVDAWGPENIVSRNELMKRLKEIKES